MPMGDKKKTKTKKTTNYTSPKKLKTNGSQDVHTGKDKQ